MKIKLDKEEMDLLDSIENGEWKPILNSSQEIKKYQDYAKQNLLKDKRINIRITSNDLELLKIGALREGIPYQTYISSILHKFINGYL
ncbi:MAG: hypothetical protein HW421_1598 [Ignavibacteria bacterium]|nr:hypothetical protein [Ignavibacteria bacterium]